MDIYIAKQGETIADVARLFGVSPYLLAEQNGMNYTQPLAEGQSIVVLFPKTTYTAKQGDTLFKISEIFGVTLRNLFRNNPKYTSNQNIFEDDTIIIEYKVSGKQKLTTNGYAYPYINQEILNSSLSYMTYLSPFTYGFNYNGDLIIPKDENLIASAANFKTSTLLHLSTLTENGTFSNELASAVLNSEQIQNRLISAVENVVFQKGFKGIDIDFEFVLPNESVLYAQFVEKIKNRLNPQGIVVYSALAPKTSASQKGNLYEGHNYGLLGNSSNGVLLMTYEWGYTYGPPMAVAPINSVKKVLEYALSEIKPEKIFLGIPNYGYDWKLPFEKGKSKARSISNVEAYELALKYNRKILFDNLSQTPYFNYTDENGAEHEVWFEDARSVSAKYNLIKEFNLFGAGFWNLMRPFQTNWSILNSMFDIA